MYTMMSFSYYGWIVCGGVLLPVGHWIYLKSQTSKLNSEIEEVQGPVRGYEISHITTMGSEIFLKSKYFTGSQPLTQMRNSMYDVPCSTSETVRKTLKLKKIRYDTQAYIHVPTRQIAKSRDRLLRDIQILKLAPSLLGAAICIGVSSYCLFSDSLLLC